MGDGLGQRVSPAACLTQGRPGIDRIVIREVQYQLELNRCRNEEIIVKGNFGWARPMWAGRPRIDLIVIREVQYQFEVKRCRNKEIIVKSKFEWPQPMWAGCPRVGNGSMHMHRCRNEEIIVKGNFGWAWPMWAGHPRINCVDIREVQYQFEVNRCINVVKGNFRWAWPTWAGRPRIDRIVIREVQYQFEDNRCRNEEIIFKVLLLIDGRTDRQTERRRSLQSWVVVFELGRDIIGTKLLTKFHEDGTRNQMLTDGRTDVRRTKTGHKSSPEPFLPNH
ncbi:hypothetical protein DPMN_041146 [Dreissena polymorpha]|uniref:Uncharacterized protein n=1 Tax=Dreissena polymorpha TaxID=45954 RepID=A0A9D4CWN8_DREPO|nr:hypothetical protein DPMN_041146 [Dreissena polymorpha]